MLTSRRTFRRAAYSTAAVALLISSAAYAVSILEFDRWMQRIEKKMLSVQKHIQRKDSQSAVMEAKEIEELYRLTQVYFESKTDAIKGVQMSKDGRDAASQMALHAAAGNFDSAQAAAKLIARDCRPCHREYKPLD